MILQRLKLVCWDKTCYKEASLDEKRRAIRPIGTRLWQSEKTSWGSKFIGHARQRHGKKEQNLVAERVYQALIGRDNSAHRSTYDRARSI